MTGYNNLVFLRFPLTSFRLSIPTRGRTLVSSRIFLLCTLLVVRTRLVVLVSIVWTLLTLILRGAVSPLLRPPIPSSISRMRIWFAGHCELFCLSSLAVLLGTLVWLDVYTDFYTAAAYIRSKAETGRLTMLAKNAPNRMRGACSMPSNSRGTYTRYLWTVISYGAQTIPLF